MHPNKGENIERRKKQQTIKEKLFHVSEVFYNHKLTETEKKNSILVGNLFYIVSFLFCYIYLILLFYFYKFELKTTSSIVGWGVC